MNLFILAPQVLLINNIFQSNSIKKKILMIDLIQDFRWKWDLCQGI